MADMHNYFLLFCVLRGRSVLLEMGIFFNTFSFLHRNFLQKRIFRKKRILTLAIFCFPNIILDIPEYFGMKQLGASEGKWYSTMLKNF
jgi:hypothetical protein